MILALDRTLWRAERLGELLCAAILFSIMVMIVVDVVMRYFFNMPLSWSYELIARYLIAALLFLALSATYRVGEHIRVDLFDFSLPPRLRAAVDVVGLAITILLFAGIGLVNLGDGVTSWVREDVVTGAIAWPTWIPHIVVFVGTGLLVLRLTLDVTSKLVVLRSGRPEPETPAGGPEA